jgi:hypothetical protein
LSKLSAIRSTKADSLATARLSVETFGEGFFEITGEVTRFLKQVSARDGTVLIYLRHTSGSLVIQENADPNVRTDRFHRFTAARDEYEIVSVVCSLTREGGADASRRAGYECNRTG